MNEKKLAAIEARLARASKGPWVRWVGTGRVNRGPASENTLCAFRGIKDGYTICDTGDPPYPENPRWSSDAEFIAHARTDVPALINAVRALTKELAVLQQQLAKGERDGEPT